MTDETLENAQSQETVAEASDEYGDPEAIQLMRIVEALLLVADEPLEAGIIAEVADISVPRVDELCSELANSYVESGRGFILQRVAGGYRFQTDPELAGYVESYVLHGKKARISAAALETLAIVAYKQPISRAQVSSIRGVNVEGVMRTLQQRGLIDVIGQDEGPGQALLYGTTASFLEQLAMDSLEELPQITDFMPHTDIVEALEQTLRIEPT